MGCLIPGQPMQRMVPNDRATWLEHQMMAGERQLFHGAGGCRFCHEPRQTLLARGPGGLAEFEKTRKPVIEQYQAAAQESMTWFENAREYVQLAPVSLAYSLMTRSGRVDLEELRKRDPAFAALCEDADYVP